MGKGAIVVSLRSKGLVSFNRGTLFDFKYHAVALATEVHGTLWLSWSAEDGLSCNIGSHGILHYCTQAVDIIISFILTFFHLSWGSLLSLIITIVIVSVDLSR